jgi:hypothetical protein
VEFRADNMLRNKLNHKIKEEEEEEKDENTLYYSLHKCVFTMQYEPYL